MATRFENVPNAPSEDTHNEKESLTSTAAATLRAALGGLTLQSPDNVLDLVAPLTSSRSGSKDPQTRGLRKGGKAGKMPAGLALYMQAQGLPRASQANITKQLWGQSLWSVLKVGKPQQRVWTFGNSLRSGGLGALDDGVGRHTSQHPIPIIEGALITSVSAGELILSFSSLTACTVFISLFLGSMTN